MQGEPPEATIAEARLVPATCAEAEAAARKLADDRVRRMKREVDDAYRAWRRTRSRCRNGYDPFVTLGSAEPSSATDSGAAAGNEGVTPDSPAGLDEADIVKSDGSCLYLAVNGALRIVRSRDPTLLSTTPLPGNARKLLVEKERAVVYVTTGGSGRKPGCSLGSCDFDEDDSATQILVFDVSNRSAPVLLRNIALSGSLVAAHRVGTIVYTVVSDAEQRVSSYPDGVNACLPDTVARQRFEDLKAENARRILSHALPTIREHGEERDLCDRFLRARTDDGGAYETITWFDIADDSSPIMTTTVADGPAAVFASQNSIYLSTERRRSQEGRRSIPFHTSLDELTVVHKFRIGTHADEVRYSGSGVVPGRLASLFPMDEYYGYLRIATRRGNVYEPDAEDVLSILAETGNGTLARVGALLRVAGDEGARSITFDGDRAYALSLKKSMPPLAPLVLDLYDPARPAVLGRLGVPGFLTYVRRLDAQHLLAIGFDVNSDGRASYFDGLFLELSDVTSPTGTKVLYKEKIGQRGSNSEAVTDHRLVAYDATRQVLAVPVTTCDGYRPTFSGLFVYRVNPVDGFTRIGTVDHGWSSASCSSWWSRASPGVKRSLFMDDQVYSIAEDRMKVQRLGRFGRNVADIALVP
jgi:hypothetical protein